MAKLSGLKPSVARLAPRIAPHLGDPRAADRHRDKVSPWRAWYATARWKALKQAVHARDLFVCQATGVTCMGRHPAPDSPVADHIIPHRGNPSLFWDATNVQTVSKAYHDREKQRAEAGGRLDRA